MKIISVIINISFIIIIIIPILLSAIFITYPTNIDNYTNQHEYYHQHHQIAKEHLRNIDESRTVYNSCNTSQKLNNMTSRLFTTVTTAAQSAALFPTTIRACEAIVSSAKARAEEALNKIYSVHSAERTFMNTADAIDIALANLEVSASLLSVISSVSPEKDVRDEANKRVVELEKYSIDQFDSNRKLYEALQQLQQEPRYRDEYQNGHQHPEYDYWVKDQIDEYKRKGMDLPEEEFKQVRELQKDIASLNTAFAQNISEDKTEIICTKNELDGVPESIVAGLTQNDKGEYVLKMDYPTYFGVMKNCVVAETRKKMSEAFNNRAYPANDNLLKEIIEKRHKLATLLHYPSFAHFYISDKMAKTPENAQHFVDELIPKLHKKWRTELELLKAHLHQSCTLTKDGLIESYDIPFMINEIKKTQLNVSETEIQEYFPMDVTVKALFDIYQAFFDIEFKYVENGDQLWHPKTSTLEVHDKQSGQLLGFIILDLFPREGKYSHACCHSVIPPVRTAENENTFTPGLSVVLANFPTATAERPALFLHDDVQTFFHEFGHAIHGLLGRSRMATFAGTRVKRDFVELPSQMLEEWIWEPAILRQISSHYKTKEPLPTELINAKVHSKNAFSARDALRQLQFANYSLAIFGLPFSSQQRDALDTAKLFADIEPRVMPGIHYEENTHFECAFGHLTGYAAGYYGYMWSKVFALDIFEYIKQHNGLLDPAIGRRYAESILNVGGGRDPNVSLREFLGREPHNKAFLRNIGIDEESKEPMSQ